MTLSSRITFALPALTLAMTLAACGSTVLTSAEQGAGGEGEAAATGDSLGGAPLPGSEAPGDEGGTDAGIPGSSTSGSTGGAPAGSTGGGSPSAPGSESPTDPDSGLAGAGETGPIEAGITYVSDGSAANAALGGAGITTGDVKANYQALVDDLNERGGINGRAIKPIFYGYEAASSQTLATQDQEACAHFTEDNNVAVVLGGGGETLDACLTKAGVMSVSSGSIINEDEVYLGQHPNLFQIGTMSQDRMMADQVDTLVRLDYFTGWNTLTGAPAATDPVIGILTIDRPYWERPLKSVFLPALADAGHPVDESNIRAVRLGQTQTELTATTADVQSATLRFQQAGVTHVLMLDASGTVTLLFAQNARNQQYYPRIGANAATGMQALHDTGAVGSNQLRGAVGLGWLPIIDVPARVGNKLANTETKRCLALMKERTGQSYDSSNAAGLALAACDSVWFMEKALSAAAAPLSLATVTAAVGRFGTSYVSPIIGKTNFAGGRHDALETGYDMAWDTGCSCARYLDSHDVPG